MKRHTVLEIYAYVMIALCLLFAMSGAHEMIRDVMRALRPELGLSEVQVVKYGHNDNYRKSFENIVTFTNDDEITAHRIAARKVAVEAVKHAAVAELYPDIPLFIIVVTVIWVHVRIAKRQRQKYQDVKPSDD